MKRRTFTSGICAIALLGTSAYATQNMQTNLENHLITIEDAVPILKSYARDSTKYSTDRKVISLYGNASVDTKDVSIIADELIYDATAQTVKIKNLQSLKLKNKEEKGKFASTVLTLKLNDKGYEVVR